MYAASRSDAYCHHLQFTIIDSYGTNLCLTLMFAVSMKKGRDPLQSTQPTVRASYDSHMGGGDITDQRWGSYLVNSGPKEFFGGGRSPSLFTALTNAALLYYQYHWCKALSSPCPRL